MKLIALLATLFSLTSPLVLVASPMKTVTATESGKPISLRVGEQLLVKLESNPSTGYSWELRQIGKSVLKSLDSTYEGKRTVPGASGVQSWILRAVAPGTITLRPEYRRPWEKHAMPAKTVEFPITVH